MTGRAGHERVRYLSGPVGTAGSAERLKVKRFAGKPGSYGMLALIGWVIASILQEPGLSANRPVASAQNARHVMAVANPLRPR